MTALARDQRGSINGTAYAEGPTIQDMGVDHRRSNVPVAEELLDGPDVVSGLE